MLARVTLADPNVSPHAISLGILYKPPTPSLPQTLFFNMRQNTARES